LWALGLANLSCLPGYDARAADQSGLVGRELEPWRSIFAVALWLQERHHVTGLFERMQALATAYRKERGGLEKRDLVRPAVEALRQMFREQGDLDRLEFTAGELACRMNALVAAEEEEEDAEGKPSISPSSVGQFLKRERLRQGPRQAGKRPWLMSHAEVDSLARAYGLGPEPDRD